MLQGGRGSIFNCYQKQLVLKREQTDLNKDSQLFVGTTKTEVQNNKTKSKTFSRK